MIKTAMIYLLAGTLLSTVWLVQLVEPLHPLLALLQPTALHLIVVGWLTQLIFGVALWMFPVRSKERPRGPEALGWSCYGLLNGGLVLRLLAEPLQSYRPLPALGWLLVGSAVLQVVACWIFVGAIWARVRPKPGRG
jgi:hypothetical protein